MNFIKMGDVAPGDAGVAIDPACHFDPVRYTALSMETLAMKGILSKIPKNPIQWSVAFVLVLVAGLWLVSPAQAGSLKPAEGRTKTFDLAAQQASDEACLACHSKPGQVVLMPNGDSLSISIDPQAFETSVHGISGLSCTGCHTNITGFPHPAKTAQSVRDFAIQNGPTCENCHVDKYQLIMDSVHQAALNQGNKNAPVCADCHNPHTQGRIMDKATGKVLPQKRVEIPQVCARCHNGIYATYKTSVHGSALIGDGNLDVPTCVDCHGVHNISDPLTTSFRLKSPQMCSNCHTDQKLMSKYNLSTQVLNTYVADFHGTTVTLFEKQSPDQQTNKPVCFDCHGVHDIARTDDPQNGLLIRQNLLAACKKCHPDATANFPASWMSHYIPTAQQNPLVFYVNLFYAILIPTVIGGMALFVLTDIVRRRIERRRGVSHS